MAEKLPVASFHKGQNLTLAQIQEAKRLRGKDGTGKFKFAPKPKAASKAKKED
jgi:hypothetical protein